MTKSNTGPSESFSGHHVLPHRYPPIFHETPVLDLYSSLPPAFLPVTSCPLSLSRPFSFTSCPCCLSYHILSPPCPVPSLYVTSFLLHVLSLLPVISYPFSFLTGPLSLCHTMSFLPVTSCPLSLSRPFYLTSCPLSLSHHVFSSCHVLPSFPVTSFLLHVLTLHSVTSYPFSLSRLALSPCHVQTFCHVLSLPSVTSCPFCRVLPSHYDVFFSLSVTSCLLPVTSWPFSLSCLAFSLSRLALSPCHDLLFLSATSCPLCVTSCSFSLPVTSCLLSVTSCPFSLSHLDLSSCPILFPVMPRSFSLSRPALSLCHVLALICLTLSPCHGLPSQICPFSSSCFALSLSRFCHFLLSRPALCHVLLILALSPCPVLNFPSVLLSDDRDAARQKTTTERERESASHPSLPMAVSPPSPPLTHAHTLRFLTA